MVILKWFSSKYRIPHRTRDIPSTLSLPDLSTLRLQQPRKTGLWQTSPSPDLPPLLHSSRLRAAFTPLLPLQFVPLALLLCVRATPKV